MGRVAMGAFMPEHGHFVAWNLQRRFDDLQCNTLNQPFGRIATRSVLSSTERRNRKCGTDSTTRRCRPCVARASSVAP